jgi:hypothetical protein
MIALRITHTVGLRATLPQHGVAIDVCARRIDTGKPQLVGGTQVLQQALLIGKSSLTDVVVRWQATATRGERITNTLSAITLANTRVEIISDILKYI